MSAEQDSPIVDAHLEEAAQMVRANPDNAARFYRL
jgi:hypothetical protein